MVTPGENLPVSPLSLPVILFRAAEYAKSDVLGFLAASFSRLPQPEIWDRKQALLRDRDKSVLEHLLMCLCICPLCPPVWLCCVWWENEEGSVGASLGQCDVLECVEEVDTVFALKVWSKSQEGQHGTKGEDVVGN